jgi:hypothetical protein
VIFSSEDRSSDDPSAEGSMQDSRNTRKFLHPVKGSIRIRSGDGESIS